MLHNVYGHERVHKSIDYCTDNMECKYDSTVTDEAKCSNYSTSGLCFFTDLTLFKTHTHTPFVLGLYPKGLGEPADV